MRAAVLAAAIFLAGAASATQDRWPALHDVHGVAAGDVLNVRSGPGVEAPIVGHFAPDTTGIEVIEPNDRQTWGMVNAGEGTGWVALSFLRRQPGQWEGSIPDIRRCLGTEPFWSLNVSSEGELEYADPEVPRKVGEISWRTGSVSRRDRSAFGASMDGVDVTGTLALGQCTDGMSDRRYGISIDLVIGMPREEPRLLSGCCTLYAAP